MLDWFRTLAAGRALSIEHAAALEDQGFVVLPGIMQPDQVEQLAHAYDASVAGATGDDVRIGSTSNRVIDFVNRGPLFDALYLVPPLLEACCHVVGRPFKLSSFHARTVRPGSSSQDMHVDVRRDTADWPLLGFIFMVDEFRPDNGATRFVPGSHRWTDTPLEATSDLRADEDGQLLACGGAGSPAHVPGVGVARSHCQHVRRAAPLAPGSVHTKGRACRHRLRRPHVARDSRAAGSTRAMGARAVA